MYSQIRLAEPKYGVSQFLWSKGLFQFFLEAKFWLDSKILAGEQSVYESELLKIEAFDLFQELTGQI